MKGVILSLKGLLEKKEDESQSVDSNGIQERSKMGNLDNEDHDKLEEFRLSAKKVELPTFDGWDPVAWITRAETYFDVQRTSEEVQIKLAKLSMDGPTSTGLTCGKNPQKKRHGIISRRQ